MITITLKINEHSKKGKAFLEMVRALFENSKEIEFIEEEKSPYNPEFVAKIGKAKNEKGRLMVTPEDLWENIK